MKKLVLFIGVVMSAVLLPATAFASIQPGPSGADYNWADAQTILGPSAESYVDGNINDDNNIFIRQGTDPTQPSGGCKPANSEYHYNGVSLINFNVSGDKDPYSGSASTATLITFTASTTPGDSNCVEHDTVITLGNTEYAEASYDWVDAGTIKAFPDTNPEKNASGDSGYNADQASQSDSGDSGSYVVGTTPNVYALSGKSTCQSYITPDASTGSYTGKYQEVLSSVGRGGAQFQKKGNCYYLRTTSNVILGDPANQFLPAGTGGGTGGGQTLAPICDVGSFSWLACPAIDAIDKGITLAEAQIGNQLEFSPLSDSSSLHSVWVSFRNLADVFFVLLFMLVIFGTAMGFDNYTVKKVLPRLVAAAILIQFSWVLVGIAVDISNVAGAGVGSMIHLIPNPNTPTNLGSGTGGVTEQVVGTLELGGAGAVALGSTIALSAAGATAVLIPLLLTIVSLLIGVLVVFLTLQLRILILQIIIVIAPFAILAWVLPNTQKMFKRWRAFLMDLLLMYPIIMLLFLGGALFSVIGDSGSNDDIQKLMAALGPIIAFLLVPTTFKVAEGALLKGGDLIANKSGLNRGQKGIEGAKKRNAENVKEQSLKKLGADQKEPPKGAFGRAKQRVAMSKAGFGFRTQEKLASQSPLKEGQMLGKVASLEKAEQDGFSRKFTEMDDTAIIKQVQGSKNANERKAGIAALAKRGNTGGLSRVLHHTDENGNQLSDGNNVYGGQAGDAEWQQAIAGSFGDVKARAPHLAKPTTRDANGNVTESPYDTLDAAGLASLDGRGHAELEARVRESPVAAANAAKVIGELDRKAALTGSSGARGGTDKAFADLRTAVTSGGHTIAAPPVVGTIAPTTTTASTNVPAPVMPSAPPPPHAGGASPFSPPSGGTPARQAPRISERLVDPRVEGDTDDNHLV